MQENIDPCGDFVQICVCVCVCVAVCRRSESSGCVLIYVIHYYPCQCVSDMSSFISPAYSDRVEQPGRVVRGLDMQMCFKCGASVCFFVHNRALVCVYLGYTAPRLQRFVCGHGRCLLDVKHAGSEEKSQASIFLL